MCDFDLERRRKDMGMNPRTGEDERAPDVSSSLHDSHSGRPRSAKYLLDWVVRLCVIVITVLCTGIFAHVRAIGDRQRTFESRIVALETEAGRPHPMTEAEETELWRELAARPTRNEIQNEFTEIKEMIRDLRVELAQ